MSAGLVAAERLPFAGPSPARGKTEVAPAPGSTHVWHRQKKELVKCTPEVCPYAEHVQVQGTMRLVNRAPVRTYAREGGGDGAFHMETGVDKVVSFLRLIDIVLDITKYPLFAAFYIASCHYREDLNLTAPPYIPDRPGDLTGNPTDVNTTKPTNASDDTAPTPLPGPGQFRYSAFVQAGYDDADARAFLDLMATHYDHNNTAVIFRPYSLMHLTLSEGAARVSRNATQVCCEYGRCAV